MAILTDTKARRIKPEDKPLAHGGVTGLTLHPSTAKGRGKWVLRYVSPLTKKRRNAGLGTYPEISIADAAREAQAMREQLANSLDPLEIRLQGQNKPKIPTLEASARLVYESLLPGWKTPNTASNGSPHWSNMPFLPLVLSPLMQLPQLISLQFCNRYG